VSHTHGSLFSGIGGFDLGFEREGFTTSWAVEIDQKAQAVLRRHFPAAALHDDVRCVGAHNLAPVDVVTFGSPCQDLSVAGKRAGLAGERSGLFHESARIIRELREAHGKPDFAIWENVPGAFSSNAGRDFAVVIQEMVNIGARDVAWRVLDSRFAGVAQRRRRVFLVADFGGERAAEVLALTEGVRGHPAKGRAARKGTAPAAGAGIGGGRWRGAYGDTAHAITCHAAKGGDPTTDNYAVAQRVCADIAPALTSSGRGVERPGESRGQDPVAAVGTGAVRRLTPTECCRLQGFPDDWNTWGISKDGKRVEMADSSRYKQLGNAVTVNVAQRIARRVADVLATSSARAQSY